jgi:SAM-dependent methyltransferase
MLMTLAQKILAGSKQAFNRRNQMVHLRNSGHCPTCDSDTTFVANEPYLRNHYKCLKCGSLPRERALMYVLELFYPNWVDLRIHESSPGGTGGSARFKRECKEYIPSQYFPNVVSGSLANGIRCENLEALSFDDASVDLHLTQDVMEHVFHPSKVFAEIARTLRPGGAHIFTVPLVKRHHPSCRRARLAGDGVIEHIEPPEYHGNPISTDGSLVTIDWGFDICEWIFRACGLFTHLVHVDDLSRGIRADLNQVLVTTKPAESSAKQL